MRKAACPLGGLEIHQIHAIGEVGGFITMVMVFVRSLCFLCDFLLVTHQSDSFYLLTIRFRGVTSQYQAVD